MYVILQQEEKSFLREANSADVNLSLARHENPKYC